MNSISVKDARQQRLKRLAAQNIPSPPPAPASTSTPTPARPPLPQFGGDGRPAHVRYANPVLSRPPEHSTLSRSTPSAARPNATLFGYPWCPPCGVSPGGHPSRSRVGVGVRVIKRRRVGVLPRQPFTVKRVEEKVGVRVGVGVKARMGVGVGVGKRGG